MTATRFFATSDELQDFLLRESGRDPGGGAAPAAGPPGLAPAAPGELAAGRAAWEPLPLVTLQGWLADLFRSLWPRGPWRRR